MSDVDVIVYLQRDSEYLWHGWVKCSQLQYLRLGLVPMRHQHSQHTFLQNPPPGKRRPQEIRALCCWRLRVAMEPQTPSKSIANGVN